VASASNTNADSEAEEASAEPVDVAGRGTDAKRIAKIVGKYFLHGLLFVALGTAFILVWVFVAAFLIVFGLIIGLIIALALLCIIYGFVNSFVTRLLWFPVKNGWKVYLVHGLLLGITLFFLETLPRLLLVTTANLQFTTDNLLPIALIYVFYAFVDGVIGKRVARIWRIGREYGTTERKGVWSAPLPPSAKNPDALRCPRCGGIRLVVESDRSAYCIDCAKGIHPTLWTARPSA
jgi:hypothetical protein